VEDISVPSTYLTSLGFQKLLNELDYLRKVKRQEIAALLSETNGGDDFDGDTNPEFDIVKQQQAFIEGRILDLEVLLSNPDIIEDFKHSEYVDIGSLVTIIEQGEEPVAYTIVGPAEASPADGLISFASPLGHALIGHIKGDEVVVNAPGGMYQVSILEVS
jgi:transcription elongation factor GreA